MGDTEQFPGWMGRLNPLSRRGGSCRPRLGFLGEIAAEKRSGGTRKAGDRNDRNGQPDRESRNDRNDWNGWKGRGVWD